MPFAYSNDCNIRQIGTACVRGVIVYEYNGLKNPEWIQQYAHTFAPIPPSLPPSSTRHSSVRFLQRIAVGPAFQYSVGHFGFCLHAGYTFPVEGSGVVPWGSQSGCAEWSTVFSAIVSVKSDFRLRLAVMRYTAPFVCDVIKAAGLPSRHRIPHQEDGRCISHKIQCLRLCELKCKNCAIYNKKNSTWPTQQHVFTLIDGALQDGSVVRLVVARRVVRWLSNVAGWRGHGDCGHQRCQK